MGANDILMYFSNFPQKIGFDTLCRSSQFVWLSYFYRYYGLSESSCVKSYIFFFVCV